MKKYIFVILTLMLVITGCSFTTKNEVTKEQEVLGDLLSGKHYVEMKFKKYGVIKLELDADEAPITVTNFIGLVNSKFYDGLTIIRVQKDFVIQGGDGSSKGLIANTITGEFLANGVDNTISHKKGVISMARSNDYDSASSQFFICTGDASESLDNYYAGFGKVIEGMKVLDKINNEAYGDDANMGFLENDKQITIEYIKEYQK